MPNNDYSITADPTALPNHVLCNTCQHEVPLSEAIVPEGVDYVIYSCGMDCYDRWQAQANRR